VVSIILIAHVPGERVGIVQSGNYLFVASKCCGARLDRRQINNDGILCENCPEREPVRTLLDPNGKEARLGTFIALSSDPDNSSSVRWWVRGWTELECEVELNW
jgi:hypothetical protein